MNVSTSETSVEIRGRRVLAGVLAAIQEGLRRGETFGNPWQNTALIFARRHLPEIDITTWSDEKQRAADDFYARDRSVPDIAGAVALLQRIVDGHERGHEMVDYTADGMQELAAAALAKLTVPLVATEDTSK